MTNKEQSEARQSVGRRRYNKKGDIEAEIHKGKHHCIPIIIGMP